MNTKLERRIEKLEEKLYIKNEITPEDMQNIVAWRKILGISDTSLDEQLFRELQKPFIQYIEEIEREEREKRNEQHN